jgi:hypothetical protein
MDFQQGPKKTQNFHTVPWKTKTFDGIWNTLDQADRIPYKNNNFPPI